MGEFSRNDEELDLMRIKKIRIHRSNLDDALHTACIGILRGVAMESGVNIDSWPCARDDRHFMGASG
jgi:hypothetical protein